jgi:hypothetical protein
MRSAQRPRASFPRAVLTFVLLAHLVAAGPALAVEGCPSFPSFPDAGCTGYQHTGVALQDYAGPMTLSVPGTVIDGKRMVGLVCITASDVTIRRSRIEGTVHTGSGAPWGACPSAAAPTNILLEDVEIVGPGTATTHDVDVSISFAVSGSHYTCRRCNVHRWGLGFQVQQNVVIEDSFIHDTIGYRGCHPALGPDCVAHRSCIGGNGAIDAVYRHNRVQCTDLNGETGVSGAIVVYSQSGFLPARNVLVEKNLLTADEASYCLYAGIGDVAPTDVRVIDNRFGRTPHVNCGLYGPILAAATDVILSGNAFTDGTPIPDTGGNQLPRADAGPDQTVQANALVVLSGAASTDPDGGPDPLTYSWSQFSGPAVALSDPSGVSPSFTPSVPGAYLFRLSVSDGAASHADEVGVTAVSPDSTPPVVFFTQPAAGATVSGTITLSAEAADDAGLAGVQFLVDGTPIGPEHTSVPYEGAWITGSVGNGPHILTARARDLSGNVGTATLEVIVSNDAPPPGIGLIAAYGFGEGSGTVASDASGRGHAGMIRGARWTAGGRFGGALLFDGADDWVTVSHAEDLDLPTGMTVMAWVRPTSLQGWTTVVLKERPSGLAYALYASDNSSRPPAAYVNVGADTASAGAASLPLFTWSHLAGTYDGVRLKLYVDGTLVASRPLAGPIAASGDPLRIGGNAVWGEFFRGRIDEVRIYGRALDQAEILRDMGLPVQP